MPKKSEKSFFFWAPAIGLVFGDLSGAKDRSKGGSGFIAPLGISIGLLLGVTAGIGRTFGITITPGVVAGRMGFLVVAIGFHLWQRIGFGIVIPVWLIW